MQGNLVRFFSFLFDIVYQLKSALTMAFSLYILGLKLEL